MGNSFRINLYIRTTIDINSRVLRFKKLFDVVKIKPDGLLAIANANFNDSNFPNVHKFI